MVRLAVYSFAVLGALSGCLAQEISCWAPDGTTLADNETYVPCNKLGIQQDGIESSCCRLDGNASNRDICAATGLCLNDGVLHRGYCTDKTWKNPACVNVCTDESNWGSSNSSVEITPCTDGKYCCGKNNLACCGTSDAFEIPMIAGVHTGSDKAKSFKSATIALAVLLGVVVVAAAAAIFWLTRKNKSLRGQVPADQPAPDMTQQQQQPYHDNSHNHDAAVHSAAPAYEAHADSTPAHSVTGSPVPQWANKPGDGYGQQQQHRYSELDGTSLANTQDQRTPGSPPLQSPDFRIAEARED